MQFVAVPVGQEASAWPLAEEYLRRACVRGAGDISADTLRAECVAYRARLLLILDGERVPAAAVARFCDQVDGTVACELVAAGGGDLAGWRHVVPEFEAWARFHGAASVRLCGRPGWARVFRGYRSRPLVCLTKDL